MTTKIGTAANYLDLLKVIDLFLTATGHAWGLTYAGTGNGRMRGPGGTVGGYIGTAASVTETITMTATSATTFDVVGSISGALGTATVGTDFTSTPVHFRIVAGATPFVAGDTFTLNVGPPWQRLRFCGCPEALLRTGTYSGVATLFDNNLAFGGVSATTLPQSVTVQMGVATPVRSFAMWNGETAAQSPNTFSLQWSDDGSTWTTAQTWTGITWATIRMRKDFVLSADPGAHLYWRINVTSSNSGTTTALTEVRLFLDAAGSVDVSSRMQFAYTAPGVDGVQEIFYLGQTYADNGLDAYNVGLRGVEFWHDRTKDVVDIPGTSGNKWWYLAKVPIAYWIVVNGGRLIVVTRISSVYQFIYNGFGLPYETPDNHQHPLIVGGVGTTASWRYDATGNNMLRNPCDPTNQSGTVCTMAAILPGGLWGEFGNRMPSSSTADGYGAGQTTGKVWPWSQNEAGTTMTEWIRANVDGSAPILPAVLQWPVDATRHTWGEFDGVYWTSGFNNSAEALLRDGPIDLLVVPNVYRTGVNHFAAIALD